jgi:hypothetical protein
MPIMCVRCARQQKLLRFFPSGCYPQITTTPRTGGTENAHTRLHTGNIKVIETTKEEVLYKDMSAAQKTVFIAKVFVFIISGGFVYPTIWVD